MAGTKRQDSASSQAKDDILAAALASGCSRVDAAKRAGMGVRTVFTRLADPDFVKLVSAYRDRIIDEAMGELATASGEATKELRKLLKHKDERVRLGAAKAIMAGVVRLGGYRDLAARMAAIEAADSGEGR